jgi:hypothetical protein
MSGNSVVDYVTREDDKEREYVMYGFLGFMALILIKFASESMYAKKKRQMRRNQLRFDRDRLQLMAQMRMATAGVGKGGGGNSSNKK